MIDRRTPSALSAAPRLDRLTGVLRGSTLGLALCLVPAASANEDQPPWVGQDPVTDALVELGPVVQTYNQHLMFLASPYLGGRLPGTPGMALARDYCEHHLRLAGLEPAFRGADGTPSFRQPFPLAGTAELVSQSLVLGSGQALVAGEDFTALSLGDSGSVRGPAVFVGYSINRAPEDSGYTSYPEGTDLSGRIAVLFRFEPMDADGHSQWATGNNPWSSRAGFAGKVRAAERLGAAAIVIVNPPGAADPRTEQLNSFRSGGKVVDVPVFHLSTAAGERLLAAGSVGQSLLDLRRQADERGVVLDLGLELVADVAIEQTELVAENVAGLLPGRGALADQLIVIGAHLDHLGLGDFGSRDPESAGKVLHPGADDNASGSAAILMLAERLRAHYDGLPAEAEARSILLMLFDAEESGLNGAFHYVREPIRPLADHSLMMNFDMIGRITGRRLSVSGVETGVGLAALVQPLFAESGLEVVANARGGGGSDHMAFEREQVPVLFGIIADFHGDYHTPRDTWDKINRVDAVRAMELWGDIALAVAQHPERLAFQSAAPAESQPEARSAPARRVRFGIQPGYEENTDEIGVLVEAVSPGGSAEEAGVLAGDRLVRWDGVKVADLADWMSKLATQEPGDQVTLGVLRDGQEVTLVATLQGN